MHKTQFGHQHTWIIGIAGLCVSAVLFIVFPSWRILSRAALFVAVFHIAVGALALLSAYLLLPSRITQHFSRPQAAAGENLDFGWSFGSMNGYWIAGTVSVVLAALLLIQLQSSPWQLVPIFLALVAVNLFAGNYVWRTGRK